MQKVVAGVGVRFDVVDQHPAGLAQLRQGLAHGSRAANRRPRGLHTGLSHQLRRHLAVLLAMHRQVFGEAPGTLIAYGLMTDSDNTRSRAEAVYSEPQFAHGR